MNCSINNTLPVFPATKTGASRPKPASHHKHRTASTGLLQEAARHAAQTRLLLCRAVRDMDPGDTAGLQAVCDALHVLTFRLERTGMREAR